MSTIEQILGRKTIHPFPARMAPSIAMDAIGKSRSRLRVLDPMAGSGTVVAVAKSQGHAAYGIDCDPLAVLNAGVWTTSLVHSSVREVAKRTLANAERLCGKTAARSAYPDAADDETRRFLRFWFDQGARRELWALSSMIGGMPDSRVKNALWSAFSRMIITKNVGVSLAMDLSHSRPHKAYVKAPVRPFQQFMIALNHVVSNCPVAGEKGIGPEAHVRVGDSRFLPFRSGFFDLVVTSPPYLNAIDYMRCSKFSLVWMGYTISDLRRIRKNSVGSEDAQNIDDVDGQVSDTVARMGDVDRLTTRMQKLLVRYVTDIRRSVSEVARVLCHGGSVVYVIGNNQMGEVFVNNANAIKWIACEFGLSQKSEYVRNLPPNRRYLPPPSSRISGQNLQGRMRTEVVLEFIKMD